MKKKLIELLERKRGEKDFLIVLAAVAAIVLILLYLAGRIAQSQQRYDIYLATGEIPEPPHNPFLTLWAAVSTGHGLLILCYFAIAGTLLFLWFKFFRKRRGTYDAKRNLYISDEGTYGSAGWMSQKELQSVLKLSHISDTSGVILGEFNGTAVSLPIDTRLNRHVAVYGASGTMKSRAFVRPYVFQAVKRGESLVLTDSKGELYSDLSEYLRDQGYTVKVFNLVSPEHSDSWNCLGEIGDNELMAQTFTQVIIENTKGEAKSDHFWDSAEANLLKALALYVQMDNSISKSDKNIGTMYELLIQQSEATLDSIFTALPAAHPAKAPYSIFKQSSQTVRSSVIVGLGSRLQVLQNKIIRQITSRDDIDLTRPAKEKCAYFCIISDQDSTLEFLSSLFFSFLFIKLVRYADTQTTNGKCELPVNIILEEFTQVGQIIDINKKISVIRSRNIHLSLIFQNIGQLQNRYPDNVWLELLGACDTQLYLGCTDPLTAEYVSDRTGEITVSVNGQRYTQAPLFRSPVHGDTHMQGRRKLLTPDEVLRLPNNEALVFLRGHNALRVNKLDYTAYPEAKKLRPTTLSSYHPEWLDDYRPYPDPFVFQETKQTPPKPPEDEPVLRRKNYIKGENYYGKKKG